MSPTSDDVSVGTAIDEVGGADRAQLVFVLVAVVVEPFSNLARSTSVTSALGRASRSGDKSGDADLERSQSSAKTSVITGINLDGGVDSSGRGTGDDTSGGVQDKAVG